MKKVLIALTISSSFLFACNNANDSEGTDSNISGDVTLKSAEPTGIDTAIAVQPTTGTEAITATGLSPVVPSQPNTSKATGLNPPHGEPGHRCDIEVGAPLNSPPGNKLPPSIQGPKATTSSTSPVPDATPKTSTVTAPGMNPPHGEPGHDCAIAVGAPLKK